MGNRASKTHLRVFVTEVARKLYYPQHDLLFAAVVNGKQRLQFRKGSRESEQRVPRPSFPLGDISPRSTFRFRHCSVDWMEHADRTCWGVVTDGFHTQTRAGRRSGQSATAQRRGERRQSPPHSGCCPRHFTTEQPKE